MADYKQTPKFSDIGSPEGCETTCPFSPTTKNKAIRSESELAKNMAQSMKFQTDRSPTVTQRCLPGNLVTKMSRPRRVSELDYHLSLLQGVNRRTKNQLASSESLKRQYQEDADEAKQQIAILSAKCEDSQCQLHELAASEEARNRELSIISREIDQAWLSELAAIHNLHSVDLSALNSATSEIQRLKMQLETVTESEAAQAKKSEKLCSELESVNQEMAKTLATIENLNVELRHSEQAKAEGESMVERTQHQLEAAQSTLEILQSDKLKLKESVAYVTSELEKSRNQESSLEEATEKLQSEVKRLSTELDGSLLKHLEEQVNKTVQINSAYELVDTLREREADLELVLEARQEEIVNLRKKLSDKETQLRDVSDMNTRLHSELMGQIVKLETDMRAKLTAEVSKLTVDLQTKVEENRMLKSAAAKREERRKRYEAVKAELESSRVSEQEIAMKYAVVSIEADNSIRRVARLAEQLGAAQAQKVEMDEELKMLRWQSGQWRKAAEEAAVVLSSENYLKFANNTNYSSSSPTRSEELYGASPKRRNNNVLLRRISGLWKN